MATAAVHTWEFRAEISPIETSINKAVTSTKPTEVVISHCTHKGMVGGGSTEARMFIPDILLVRVQPSKCSDP